MQSPAKTATDIKIAARLRAIRKADKAVQRIIDIIFIIILLIALYFLVDTIWVYYNARADLTMPHKPTEEDPFAYRELSEDCIGWITLDNTSIDYPIMQGVDNYEYLNKDPYGEYSLSGSIYLDSRNASDFTDQYSILYGHHMSQGYMFGALDDFEDKDFFKEHNTGALHTERGEFPVKVLAFVYTDAADEIVFDPEGDKSALPEWIEKRAVNHNDYTDGERIVALSTCKSPTSTRRMIVFVTIDESKW